MSTVAALLTEARSAGLDRLDAHLLMCHALARPRAWLIAHDADPVGDVQAVAYRSLCAERARGVPVAYLIGEKEFHGLRLRVSPAVLVPRPETELLVDWAIELLDGPLAGRPAPAAIDLGTGSGAIALAVKRARPAVAMTATDLSAAALTVATDNALALDLDVTCAAGDWWGACPGGRFDLVLSNPPYIDGDDAHLPALHAEPLAALSPGRDGLDALRRIVAGGMGHTTGGAWMLLEHGFDQAAAVRALLTDAGFELVQTRHDLAGQPRCTAGRRAQA